MTHSINIIGSDLRFITNVPAEHVVDQIARRLHGGVRDDLRNAHEEYYPQHEATMENLFSTYGIMLEGGTIETVTDLNEKMATMQPLGVGYRNPTLLLWSLESYLRVGSWFLWSAEGSEGANFAVVQPGGWFLFTEIDQNWLDRALAAADQDASTQWGAYQVARDLTTQGQLPLAPQQAYAPTWA